MESWRYSVDRHEDILEEQKGDKVDDAVEYFFG